MDPTEFRALETPAALPDAVQALWWDAQGDWPLAHRHAQVQDDVTGALVHAYLHRKEGDLSNAAYWYARAARPMPAISLDAEWEALVRALA